MVRRDRRKGLIFYTRLLGAPWLLVPLWQGRKGLIFSKSCPAAWLLPRLPFGWYCMWRGRNGFIFWFWTNPAWFRPVPHWSCGVAFNHRRNGSIFLNPHARRHGCCFHLPLYRAGRHENWEETAQSSQPLFLFDVFVFRSSYIFVKAFHI